MRWGTFFVLGTTFALTSLLPRVASADGSNADVIIYLTGGKEIRGSVVEMVPGKHYVVIRSDGTTLKLPSSAVRAIAPPYGPPPPPEPPAQKRSEPEPSAQDDVPPSASSASSASSAESPRPSMARGPVAIVELKSDKPLQLQWSPEGSGRWETACMSPCNVALPVERASYRIVDDRGRPGKAFQLPHDGRVTIQAISRSGGMDAMGGIALGVGSIAFLGGAGTADEARSNDSGPAVAILFGLSAVVLGTILLCVNSSSVQIDGATKESGRVDRAPRRAFYRDSSIPPLPRAMGGTLFSVHF